MKLLDEKDVYKNYIVHSFILKPHIQILQNPVQILINLQLNGIFRENLRLVMYYLRLMLHLYEYHSDQKMKMDFVTFNF